MLLQTSRPTGRVVPTALALLGLILLPLAPAPAAAATLPPGFQESVVLSGLTLPTAARFAADGRIFVAEKSGLVKVFDGLGDPTPQVFADLRTQVHNFADRGLLGLALHPDYPGTPWVYVLYTADAEIGGSPPRWGTPGASTDGCPTPPGSSDGCVVSGRLSRLTGAGNSMEGGETVLLENWCQQFDSHSIGALTFGPDGALYVSGGDGASYTFIDYGQRGFPEVNACGDPPVGLGGVQDPATSQGGSLRSQNVGVAGYDRATFDGKILRVDPATGAALPGNPLFGSPVPGADRIVARGFRNPLRMAFRPGTDELWIGDVGWTGFEEINRLQRSTTSVRNFGWPCHEGPGPQSGWAGLQTGVCEMLYAAPGAVEAPWFAYDRTTHVVPGDGCEPADASISGLAFYEGGGYPPQYDGALFFADYSRGCIWTMFADGSGVPNPNDRATFVSGASFPVDLQIGPGGDLFYVDIATGTLRRVQAFDNEPPVAALTADPTVGPAPLTVQFDASGSFDPEGAGPLTFAWDFDGNGTFETAAGAQPQRVFDTPGSIDVGVEVTDAMGASATATVRITPGNTPPAVTITAPAAGLAPAVGDTVFFTGEAFDAQDGPLPPSALSWTLVLEHCPGDCHTHPIEERPGVASGDFVMPEHEHPSHVNLSLTATDSNGSSTTVVLPIVPRTADLLIASEPPGLTIAAGAGSRQTPFVLTLAVGATTTLGAPSPQTLGGVSYRFQSWSDGGAAVHDVVATDGGATLTARFGPAVATTTSTTSSTSTSSTTATSTSSSTSTTVPGGRTTTSTTVFGATTTTSTRPVDALLPAGKKLMLKQKKSGMQRLYLVARGEKIAVDDGVAPPCAIDGELVIEAIGAGRPPMTFPLEADLWRPIRKARPERGCKYRLGPEVLTVLLRPGKMLKVVAVGEDFGVPLAVDPRPVRIAVRHGAVTHCVEFGGAKAKLRPDKKLLVRRAEPATRCPQR